MVPCKRQRGVIHPRDHGLVRLVLLVRLRLVVLVLVLVGQLRVRKLPRGLLVLGLVGLLLVFVLLFMQQLVLVLVLLLWLRLRLWLRFLLLLLLLRNLLLARWRRVPRRTGGVGACFPTTRLRSPVGNHVLLPSLQRLNLRETAQTHPKVDGCANTSRHVRVHARTHTRTHTHMDGCTFHTHTHTHTHTACMHARTHARTHPPTHPPPTHTHARQAIISAHLRLESADPLQTGGELRLHSAHRVQQSVSINRRLRRGFS